MLDLNICSFKELIESAFGEPENNAVNFKVIQTILYLLARQLGVLDRLVQVDLVSERPSASQSSITVTEIKIKATATNKNLKDVNERALKRLEDTDTRSSVSDDKSMQSPSFVLKTKFVTQGWPYNPSLDDVQHKLNANERLHNTQLGKNNKHKENSSNLEKELAISTERKSLKEDLISYIDSLEDIVSIKKRKGQSLKSTKTNGHRIKKIRYRSKSENTYLRNGKPKKDINMENTKRPFEPQSFKSFSEKVRYDRSDRKPLYRFFSEELISENCGPQQHRLNNDKNHSQAQKGKESFDFTKYIKLNKTSSEDLISKVGKDHKRSGQFKAYPETHVIDKTDDHAINKPLYRSSSEEIYKHLEKYRNRKKTLEHDDQQLKGRSEPINRKNSRYEQFYRSSSDEFITKFIESSDNDRFIRSQSEPRENTKIDIQHLLNSIASDRENKPLMSIDKIAINKKNREHMINIKRIDNFRDNTQFSENNTYKTNTNIENNSDENTFGKKPDNFSLYTDDKVSKDEMLKRDFNRENNYDKYHFDKRTREEDRQIEYKNQNNKKYFEERPNLNTDNMLTKEVLDKKQKFDVYNENLLKFELLRQAIMSKCNSKESSQQKEDIYANVKYSKDLSNEVSEIHLKLQDVLLSKSPGYHGDKSVRKKNESNDRPNKKRYENPDDISRINDNLDFDKNKYFAKQPGKNVSLEYIRDLNQYSSSSEEVTPKRLKEIKQELSETKKDNRKDERYSREVTNNTSPDIIEKNEKYEHMRREQLYRSSSEEIISANNEKYSDIDKSIIESDKTSETVNNKNWQYPVESNALYKEDDQSHLNSIEYKRYRIVKDNRYRYSSEDLASKQVKGFDEDILVKEESPNGINKGKHFPKRFEKQDMYSGLQEKKEERGNKPSYQSSSEEVISNVVKDQISRKESLDNFGVEKRKESIKKYDDAEHKQHKCVFNQGQLIEEISQYDYDKSTRAWLFTNKKEISDNSESKKNYEKLKLAIMSKCYGNKPEDKQTPRSFANEVDEEYYNLKNSVLSKSPSYANDRLEKRRKRHDDSKSHERHSTPRKGNIHKMIKENLEPKKSHDKDYQRKEKPGYQSTSDANHSDRPQHESEDKKESPFTQEKTWEHSSVHDYEKSIKGHAEPQKTYHHRGSERKHNRSSTEDTNTRNDASPDYYIVSSKNIHSQETKGKYNFHDQPKHNQSSSDENIEHSKRSGKKDYIRGEQHLHSSSDVVAKKEKAREKNKDSNWARDRFSREVNITKDLEHTDTRDKKDRHEQPEKKQQYQSSSDETISKRYKTEAKKNRLTESKQNKEEQERQRDNPQNPSYLEEIIEKKRKKRGEHKGFSKNFEDRLTSEEIILKDPGYPGTRKRSVKQDANEMTLKEDSESKQRPEPGFEDLFDIKKKSKRGQEHRDPPRDKAQYQSSPNQKFSDTTMKISKNENYGIKKAIKDRSETEEHISKKHWQQAGSSDFEEATAKNRLNIKDVKDRQQLRTNESDTDDNRISKERSRKKERYSSSSDEENKTKKLEELKAIGGLKDAAPERVPLKRAKSGEIIDAFGNRLLHDEELKSKLERQREALFSKCPGFEPAESLKRDNTLSYRNLNKEKIATKDYDQNKIQSRSKLKEKLRTRSLDSSSSDEIKKYDSQIGALFSKSPGFTKDLSPRIKEKRRQNKYSSKESIADDIKKEKYKADDPKYIKEDNEDDKGTKFINLDDSENKVTNKAGISHKVEKRYSDTILGETKAVHLSDSAKPKSPDLLNDSIKSKDTEYKKQADSKTDSKMAKSVELGRQTNVDDFRDSKKLKDSPNLANAYDLGDPKILKQYDEDEVSRDGYEDKARKQSTAVSDDTEYNYTKQVESELLAPSGQTTATKGGKKLDLHGVPLEVFEELREQELRVINQRADSREEPDREPTRMLSVPSAVKALAHSTKEGQNGKGNLNDEVAAGKLGKRISSTGSRKLSQDIDKEKKEALAGKRTWGESSRTLSQDIEEEKVLVVERIPLNKEKAREYKEKHKDAPLAVVKIEEFEALVTEVKELEARMRPASRLSFPGNAELIEHIRNGASLTEAMAALQLSARIEAAENALENIIEMVSKLAAQNPDVDIDKYGQTIMKSSIRREETKPIDYLGLDQYPGGVGPSQKESGAKCREGCITKPEFDSEISKVQNELAKEIGVCAKKNLSKIDLLAKNLKHLESKVEDAVHMSNRISDLENSVSSYSERINAMDTGLSVQMTSYQDQLTQMQHELEEGLENMAETLANAEGDPAAVAELHAKLNILQNDLVNTSNIQSELEKNEHDVFVNLKDLFTQIEHLRETKADREEVEDALQNKAGLSALNGLISLEHFDALIGDMESHIGKAYDKFNNQELIWQKAINDLVKELNEKTNLEIVLNLRDDINNKLNMITERINSLRDIVGEPKAFGVSKRINVGAECLSCKTPAQIEPEAKPSRMPAMKSSSVSAGGARRKEAGDACFPGYPIPHPLDPRTHICNRYCGGSHTVLKNVARAKSLPGAVTIQKWEKPMKTEAGTDGKTYFVEDLNARGPCKPCNIRPSVSTIEISPKPNPPVKGKAVFDIEIRECDKCPCFNVEPDLDC